MLGTQRKVLGYVHLEKMKNDGITDDLHISAVSDEINLHKTWIEDSDGSPEVKL
jgi:hypothetical protein